MTGFLRTGTDLDSIFDPLGLNATSANTGFTIQGADIGQIYSPAGSGSPATNTNFLSNGTDIGPLFASRGSVNNTPVNGYYSMWGYNTSAVLGIGAVYSWKHVGIGRFFGGAIRSDGRLFMWGSNSDGELGLGNTTEQLSPVAVGSSSWTMIAAGGADSGNNKYTLAIKSDGTLWAWGNNAWGQLGTNNITNYSSPVQIGTSSYLQIVASGSASSFGITTDNRLFAWGVNENGNLGLGTSGLPNISSPTQVGSSSWTSVSAGGAGYARINAGAIRSDGALFMWGRNNQGQVGDGTTTQRSSPVQIGTDSWVLVSAGMGDSLNPGHTLAIRQDNTLWAWGSSNVGQLGDGTTIDKSSPVQIGSSSWSVVSAGFYYSLGVKVDGTLWSWGSSTSGKTGDPNQVVNPSSPIQIGTSVASWSNVYAGKHMFGMMKAGSDPNAANVLYGAGGSYTGFAWTAAGTSNFWTVIWPYWSSSAPNIANSVYRSKPTITLPYTQSSWKATGFLTNASGSATEQVVVALRSDGILFTWGPNGFGQCGVGDTTTPKSSPVQVGSSSWTMVATGSGCVYAIRADNTLWAWGSGANGRLGTGNTTSTSSPVQVGASSWTMVKGGTSSAAAIRSDGTLWTWGSGSSGVLGDGTTIAKSSPVQVGARIWSTISVGDSWMVGIQAGRLYAWGGNLYGQLGQNNTTARSSPVQIGTRVWRDVKAGQIHCLAIDVDFKLWAWGSNSLGRLGDGTITSRSSPVQIGTESYILISAGPGQSFGIRSNRNLYAWGDNGLYQLGDTTGTNRSSPVLIGTQGSPWHFVSAGYYGTIAIGETPFEN